MCKWGTGDPVMQAGCIPENQCAYQKHVKWKIVTGSQKNSIFKD